MKSPSTPPLPLSDESKVTNPVRVQILATEHWSLLATRSMIWNETFSRTSMFLTVLSAAVVALALVAQATAFGQGFRIFALVVLPIVLILGVGTFIRLGSINEYDFWLMAGMNRLRHAYLELAPELEPYFVTGQHDDIIGVWQSYSPGWLFQPSSSTSSPFGLGLLLSSTPNIVGAINSVVAGVLVTLTAETLGAPVAVGVVAGVVAGLITIVLHVSLPMNRISRMRRDHRPKFPTSPVEEQTGAKGVHS